MAAPNIIGIPQKQSIFYYDESNPQSKSCLIAIKLLEYNAAVMQVTRCSDCCLTPILMSTDFTLSDGHATLMYLCDTSDRPIAKQLFPSDLNTRYHIINILFFESIVLEQLIKKPDGMRNGVHKTWCVYDTLESLLMEKSFMMGDVVTLADISLISSVMELYFCLPVEYWRWPKLYLWILRMLAIPAVNSVFMNPENHCRECAPNCCKCRNNGPGGWSESCSNTQIVSDVAGFTESKPTATKDGIQSELPVFAQEPQKTAPLGIVDRPTWMADSPQLGCTCMENGEQDVEECSMPDEEEGCRNEMIKPYQPGIAASPQLSSTCMENGKQVVEECTMPDQKGFVGEATTNEATCCCTCDINQIQEVVEQLRGLGKKEVTITIKLQMSTSCMCHADETNTRTELNASNEKSVTMYPKPLKAVTNKTLNTIERHYATEWNVSKTRLASGLNEENQYQTCCSEESNKSQKNMVGRDDYYKMSHAKLPMNANPYPTDNVANRTSTIGLNEKNHNEICCCTESNNSQKKLERIEDCHRKSYQKLDMKPSSMPVCPQLTSKRSSSVQLHKDDPKKIRCPTESNKSLKMLERRDDYHRKSHEKLDRNRSSTAVSPELCANGSKRRSSVEFQKENPKKPCCPPKSNKSLKMLEGRQDYHRKSHEKLAMNPSSTAVSPKLCANGSKRSSAADLHNVNPEKPCCPTKTNRSLIMLERREDYHSKTHEKLVMNPCSTAASPKLCDNGSKRNSTIVFNQKYHNKPCCCTECYNSRKDLEHRDDYHRKSHEKLNKKQSSIAVFTKLSSKRSSAVEWHKTYSKEPRYPTEANKSQKMLDRREDYRRKSHEKQNINASLERTTNVSKISSTVGFNGKIHNEVDCCTEFDNSQQMWERREDYHRKNHEKLDMNPSSIAVSPKLCASGSKKSSTAELHKEIPKKPCCPRDFNKSQQMLESREDCHSKSHEKLDMNPSSAAVRPKLCASCSKRSSTVELHKEIPKKPCCPRDFNKSQQMLERREDCQRKILEKLDMSPSSTAVRPKPCATGSKKSSNVELHTEIPKKPCCPTDSNKSQQMLERKEDCQRKILEKLDMIPNSTAVRPKPCGTGSKRSSNVELHKGIPKKPCCPTESNKSQHMLERREDCQRKILEKLDMSPSSTAVRPKPCATGSKRSSNVELHTEIPKKPCCPTDSNNSQQMLERREDFQRKILEKLDMSPSSTAVRPKLCATGSKRSSTVELHKEIPKRPCCPRDFNKSQQMLERREDCHSKSHETLDMSPSFTAVGRKLCASVSKRRSTAGCYKENTKKPRCLTESSKSEKKSEDDSKNTHGNQNIISRPMAKNPKSNIQVRNPSPTQLRKKLAKPTVCTKPRPNPH